MMKVTQNNRQTVKTVAGLLIMVISAGYISIKNSPENDFLDNRTEYQKIMEDEGGSGHTNRMTLHIGLLMLDYKYSDCKSNPAKCPEFEQSKAKFEKEYGTKYSYVENRREPTY